jgi:hypothetical protein
MNLKETGCMDIEWNSLAQDRKKVASSCDYGDEPSGFIK